MLHNHKNISNFKNRKERLITPSAGNGEEPLKLSYILVRI